jgi:ElaA protein
MAYLRFMNLRWSLKDWSELTIDELYEILALRIRVFVIEQNCPYQDADGKDRKSLHLFASNPEGECMACLRLVRSGVSYPEWSIGRVVSDLRVRNTGTGRLLMQKAMSYFEGNNIRDVRISAQCYLTEFYKSFGFVPVGEIYDEDNIPHIQMIYSKPTS